MYYFVIISIIVKAFEPLSQFRFCSTILQSLLGVRSPFAILLLRVSAKFSRKGPVGKNARPKNAPVEIVETKETIGTVET